MVETVVAPNDARKLAYSVTDYSQTLRRVFDGVNSKEDLLASLGTSGSVILVNSGTVSSTDELFQITGFTTDYPLFWIDLDGLLVDEASKVLHLRTRKSGDSSPESGSADYSWNRWQMGNSSQANTTGNFSDTELDMLTIAGSTVGTNEEMVGRIHVMKPMDATQQTFIWWEIGWVSSTTIYNSWGGGYRKAKQADDSLYLVTDSGTPTTFATGNYRLYGIKQ